MRDQLVWFQNDLRVHDHAPLFTACRDAMETKSGVVAVFIVDPRFFGQTPFGFDRIGSHRLEFLRQSLTDLDHTLRAAGNRLLILEGQAEFVLPKLAQQINASVVHFYQQFPTEERSIQDRMIDTLKEIGIPSQVAPAATMHDFAAFPFPVEEAPDVFSKFRKIVEQKLEIPDPLTKPCQIPSSRAPVEQLSDAVEFRGFKFTDQNTHQFNDHNENLGDHQPNFLGGETAAWQRIQQYVWKRDCLRDYKRTRNGLLGMDYSSKFSPWLAMGCVSARAILAEVVQYEQQRVTNDSTYWMKFELLWRDYFALTMAKHQEKVFQVAGLRGQNMDWNQDWSLFDHWRFGKTGYPLIDACMRELAMTGFMSNRGRQNVGSFLTKNLGIDWRMGAEWFESMLIDYDPCSNYGNWNYIAGVGNDPRGFRWFNTIKQSNDYDRDGNYVCHWLPSLANVPSQKTHTPWEMDSDEQDQSGCEIGVDYPRPIVDLFESANHQQKIYERQKKQRID